MNASETSVSSDAEKVAGANHLLRPDRAILDRAGAVWMIQFEGVVRHLAPLKGLDYLSFLLRNPGRRIPALELEQWAASRPRTEGQARVNVTRAIQSVIGRLDKLHPRLAEHLRATVRTGKACCYRPDPRAPIEWSTASR